MNRLASILRKVFLKPWAWYVVMILLGLLAAESLRLLVRWIQIWPFLSRVDYNLTRPILTVSGIGLALLITIAGLIFLCRRATWQRFIPPSREDSPPARLLIHLALILACVATVYPALRVISVSLRPGDRLMSTNLAIIPPDANPFLFSVEAEIADELDQGDLSSRLQHRFQQHGRSLTAAARVQVDQPGRRWTITGMAASFSILKVGDSLNVYWTPNYIVVLTGKFPGWLWNSLIITISTATFGVILAATSAYAFSRWRFPGRGPGLIFLLATQMIPAAMLTVPIYILATRLGLYDSYRGLVLAYSVGSIPFSIWILKGYYDTIPIDLEEAAMIDGASRISAFIRVILPLSTPALAIVFLFNFMTAWNDFLLARIMLQQEELLTWTRGLVQMQGQFQTQWGQFAAASIIVSVPVMALFLYSSKWLISGLTLGSVKG